MAPSSHFLSKRQDCTFGGCDTDSSSGSSNDNASNFWWSNDGYYVRYAVIAAVIIVAILVLLFGYFHAQRRMKRGLEPLPYHRWLVRRANRGPRYNNQYPPQNTYAYYQQPGQTYPMSGSMPPNAQQQPQGWAPPPPAYGQHPWDAPPTYAPPPGASKAAADQNVAEVTTVPREHGEGSSTVSLPQQAHQPPGNDHTITQ